jgi:hypothetical protein
VLTQLRSTRGAPQYSCVGEGLCARFGPNCDSLVSTCESARDNCLNGSEPYTPPEDTACDDTDLELAKACTITAAEYETCIGRSGSEHGQGRDHADL